KYTTDPHSKHKRQSMAVKIELRASVATARSTALGPMIKIWTYAFWREPVKQHTPLSYRGMMVPPSVLIIFTIFMGIWAQPFLNLAVLAASTIVNPKEYISVVMGIKQIRKKIEHPHHDESHPKPETDPHHATPTHAILSSKPALKLLAYQGLNVQSGEN
ncbi:hypothetical protein TI03_05830, partial [Achromatium sp. WMS1]